MVCEVFDAVRIGWIRGHARPDGGKIQIVLEPHGHLRDHVTGWTTHKGCTQDFRSALLAQYLLETSRAVTDSSIKLCKIFGVGSVFDFLVLEFLLSGAYCCNLRVCVGSSWQLYFGSIIAGEEQRIVEHGASLYV